MRSLISEKEKTDRKRVVVDTSILISAVIVDGSYRKLLHKLLAADFELCIPQEVIDEFQEIIKKDKFRKYEPIFVEIFEELRKSSILLPYPSTYKFSLEKNKEDEGIINCCAENKVEYLITSDKNTVGKYNGLTVIFAQEFYSLFLTN
ncbi:MAG: putative toxin-antitoxin system toxin component, PIN family [Candidatus Levybacteria bacterium]|nr:putative toxin-antitoxin system toxin component, PIN family [Candidatus Levybacteria bacterium]